MTTVAEIIILALKDVNILDEAETPSAAMTADAFTNLKQMLSLWQLDGHNVYATTEASYTPVGAETFTIGPGGDVSILAPTDINYIYHVVDSISYEPLYKCASLEEYQTLSSIPVVAYPSLFYYSRSIPLSTVYIYPQPSTGTLKIGHAVNLPVYTGTVDALSLPPAYDMAVRFNLAMILGPTMGHGIPPMVEKMAIASKRALVNHNIEINELKTSPRYMTREERFKRGYA